MSDDQLNKLAKLMQQGFKEQEERLETKFDERFAEQDARIDEKLGQRFAEQETRIDKKLNLQLAAFMGQLTKHVDDRIDAAQASVESKLDQVQKSLDGIAKRVTTDDQERAVQSHQVDRHEDWIVRAADAVEVSYDPAA